MTGVYEQNGCSILAVQNVEPADTVNYGIVKCGPGMNRLHPITGMVEKPAPEKAPSTLGVVGRYVLTPKIFNHLEQIEPGAGGEIQLTDGIASLITGRTGAGLRIFRNPLRLWNQDRLSQGDYRAGASHPEVGREFAEYLDTYGRRNSAA